LATSGEDERAGGAASDRSPPKGVSCNVASATSTRDDVVIHFGLSHAAGPEGEIRSQLVHRIRLTPFAARRLQELLSALIGDYDTGRRQPR
jgi:hypothetical protein